MNVRDFVHFEKEKIEDERKTKFRIKNVACVTHTDLINQHSIPLETKTKIFTF